MNGIDSGENIIDGAKLDRDRYIGQSVDCQHRWVQ